MKVLVIDVGGNHVKILATGQDRRRRFASGPALSAQQMAAGAKRLAKGWHYDAVAIGYPDFVSVAGTTINQTGQALEGVAMIMIVYLCLSLSTSAFMNWYNKKVALVER